MTRSLNRLDTLTELLLYIPLDTPTMLRSTKRGDAGLESRVVWRNPRSGPRHLPCLPVMLSILSLHTETTATWAVLSFIR